MSEPEGKRSKWGVVAAIVAGVLASACCTVPLLLVTLGVGGAWVSSFTALEPFRPYFIAMALGVLAYAGYREYRNARGPQCDCEMTLSDKVRRALLGVGALITLGLIVSPWVIKGTNDVSAAEVFAQESGLEEAVLDIRGMTCDACAVTVHKALTQLDGVAAAQVTYEPPRAVVRYDPEVVSLEEIVQATANVGYPGTPEAGLEEVVLDVEGMTCDACSVTLHKALTRLDGVAAAQVTYEPPRAVVRYDPEVVSLEEIVQATANVGYPGTPVQPKKQAGL